MSELEISGRACLAPTEIDSCAKQNFVSNAEGSLLYFVTIVLQSPLDAEWVRGQGRRYFPDALSRSGYRHLWKKSTATVIVVDDDASIRRSLRTLLQVLKFNVLVFASAEDLLASELPTGPVCLLLDMYLPGMSGIELCGSLAASGRQLPTVLMSGRDDQQTKQIMREAKSVASLFKPFDEKTLLRVIRKALRDAPPMPH
jgi:CheY-like chemotaxis protein